MKAGYRNMDTFFHLETRRRTIERWVSQYFNGCVLDVGCGRMPYKEAIMQQKNVNDYIGIDIDNPIYQKELKPDVFWDGKNLPLKESTANCILLTEVLEHVPEPMEILKEMYRVMKKDGLLFITVPFFWGLHDIPNDEYRYTPFAMERMLKAAGFEVVELSPSGRWNASLASALAQYSRRHLVGRRKKYLSIVLFPLVKYLFKTDLRNNRTGYVSGEMITGLHCVAKKIY